MSHATGATPRRGTRWGRTTLLALPALGAMGAMLSMVSSNVIASSFVLQQGEAEFSTSRAHGDTVALGVVTVDASTGIAGGTVKRNVLRAGFADANLNGFCVSQVQRIGTIDYTVKVSSGDGNPASFESTGKNIVLDVTQIRGTSDPGINLDGLVEIGPRSSSLRTVPDALNPSAYLNNPLDAPTTGNYLGIQASVGELYMLRGQVRDLQIGGPLDLPGLSITVVRGGPTCSQLPIPN